MAILNKLILLAFIASNALVSYAFVPHQQIHSQHFGRTNQALDTGLVTNQRFNHPSGFEQKVLAPHRKSVANVQTMGLFGLGTGEIVIVLAAAAFIIGPESLGNMAGQLKGDLPDDLKRIPEEFQKGFEESTENSKARNAKQMEAVPDEDSEGK